MGAGASSIAIIGAGVAGLVTALELGARGRETVVYAPSAMPETSRTEPTRSTGSPASRDPIPASFVAPALFTPYPLPDEPLFRRATEYSLQVLTRLSHQHPESGVSLSALHEYLAHPEAERGWLSDLLRTTPIRPLPPGMVQATATTRPHIDMRTYMPWLASRARAEGVRFVDARIDRFTEVFARGHRVVVNCTGLGAARLTHDPLIKPMHGQLLHVPNDIGLTHSVHDDASGDRVRYVFAFRDRLVLGGSFIAGRDDDATDQPTIGGIIDRCRSLLNLDGFPRWNDLARGGEIRRTAARRPTRGPDGVWEQLRLDREDHAGGVVVHHYGHGRAGASLSWGTAREAAEMAIGAQ
jgi:D-amino-acid oxidase